MVCAAYTPVGGATVAVAVAAGGGGGPETSSWAVVLLGDDNNNCACTGVGVVACGCCVSGLAASAESSNMLLSYMM